MEKGVETVIAHDKQFSIRGSEVKYYVPEEISYDQWEKINSLLDDAKINLLQEVDIANTNGKTKVSASVGAILQKLFKAKLLPSFFATILIPVGKETWDEDLYEKQLPTMNKIGDKTALEVAVLFLSGRSELIVTITNYLVNLFKENNFSQIKSQIENVVEKVQAD